MASDKKAIIYLIIALCPYELAKGIALIEDQNW